MSTTLKNFGFAFTLALGIAITGCAADSPANPTGGGSDTGGGGDTGGGDDVPTPLDATGKYHVQSTFDIASNMPGTVGTVVNDFIAATDDADDPDALDPRPDHRADAERHAEEPAAGRRAVRRRLPQRPAA